MARRKENQISASQIKLVERRRRGFPHAKPGFAWRFEINLIAQYNWRKVDAKGG
jgi:hypothetical protein